MDKETICRNRKNSSPQRGKEVGARIPQETPVLKRGPYKAVDISADKSGNCADNHHLG